MADGNENLARIDAMLAQAKQALFQAARWQSAVERQIESTQQWIASTQQEIASTQSSIRELNKAREVDAENIRRLADIALAHQTRIDSHETRIDDLERGNAQ